MCGYKDFGRQVGMLWYERENSELFESYLTGSQQFIAFGGYVSICEKINFGSATGLNSGVLTVSNICKWFVE